MLVESKATAVSRRALFPGASCFALGSPEFGAPLPSETDMVCDQLHVICSVIGSPTEETIASMHNEHSKTVLREMPLMTPRVSGRWGQTLH